LQPCFKRGNKLLVEDGILLWELQLLVPLLLKELFHPGVFRMKATTRAHMWWPGLDKAVEEHVQDWTKQWKSVSRSGQSSRRACPGLDKEVEEHVQDWTKWWKSMSRIGQSGGRACPGLDKVVEEHVQDWTKRVKSMSRIGQSGGSACPIMCY
jgi:hypothetical protein